MTKAAGELHLTQSGVSQHVKSLEQDLGVRLFDRINRKLMPTPSGEKLFSKTQGPLFQLAGAVFEVSQKEVEIRGTVRIGLPIEFGNNVIIPKLAEIGKRYPGLRFDLTLDFASQLYDLLLSGELDFAFVDGYESHRKIELEKVSGEILELCCSHEYFNAAGAFKNTKTYFESLDYVDYQEGEQVLRSWFSFHLKRKNLKLNMRAHVMDVQAIAKFIKNGLGLGVLPNHLVAKLEAQGIHLYKFQGCGKSMVNQLSLADLENRSLSTAASLVKNELKEFLLKKKGLME